MKKVALLFAALLAYAGLAFAAVNINSATREQLESLDGVGPVRAQAIIDYRKKNGSFKSLEDVKKVDGVGDVTFEKIKKDISLSGTTTMPAKADTKAAVKEKASDTKAAVKEKAADTKAAVKEKAADTKAAAKEAAADTKATAKKTADKVEKKADTAKEKAKKEADEKKKKEDEKKK